MKFTTTLCTSILTLAVGTFSVSVVAKDALGVVDFVNEASANGIAEVESAKTALEKSTNAEVKTFAQQLIDDYTASNKDLAAIAQRKKLNVVDNEQLLTKAKMLSLHVREGESYDEAFIKNEVKTHRDTLELFNKAAVLKDVELAGFATENIPKLEHQLKFAEKMEQDFAKK